MLWDAGYGGSTIAVQDVAAVIFVGALNGYRTLIAVGVNAHGTNRRAGADIDGRDQNVPAGPGCTGLVNGRQIDIAN